MARIGGRNSVLAWLAGLASLAVVVCLVWLAVPMTPVVAAWAENAVSGVLNPPSAHTASPSPSPTEVAPPPAPAAVTGPPTTCAELYPTALWDQLQAAHKTSLDESIVYPPSAVAGLPEAFGARMTLGCTWTDAEGASTVTLAEVTASAPDTAQRVLTANGFVCTPLADGTRCDLAAGDESPGETHVLRGGLWLSVVRTFPGPPVDQVSAEARVWP